MILTMVIISALLAGAAAVASMQLKSSRGADLARSQIASLHCAEAGVVAARATVMNSYAQWNGSLTATTEPSWLASIDHDIDDDGSPDFVITLRDNDDETPNDPTRDNDLTIYIESTCVKYADVRTQVSELVRFNGGANCYQAQLGGCGGNNNAN